MKMNRPYFQPIFFPTKVAVVDDDPDCLAQIKTLICDDFACDIFTSPIGALREMRSYTEKNISFVKQCSPRIALDNDLYKYIDDDQRFNRFSVVLVDYSMPGMNGLEFCRHIREPWIKKILITGYAGLDVAVDAFNEGVIDHFIHKQDDDFDVRLNTAIKELSYQFFNDACQNNIELENAAPYLFNKKFGAWFNKLCRDNCFVEYYLKHKCLLSEFLLVNKDGDIKLLFVQTPEQIQSQIEITIESNDIVPGKLYQAIFNSEVIPYFSGRCIYDASYKSSWEKYVYPGERVDRYICALVDAQDLPELGVERATHSYSRFLKGFYASEMIN